MHALVHHKTRERRQISKQRKSERNIAYWRLQIGVGLSERTENTCDFDAGGPSVKYSLEKHIVNASRPYRSQF